MNSLSREFEIWQCLETYMFVTREGGDATVSYWIEARNAAAKTELDRTAPPSTRKELSASQMSVMLSLRNPASVFILPSVWSFLISFLSWLELSYSFMTQPLCHLLWEALSHFSRAGQVLPFCPPIGSLPVTDSAVLFMNLRLLLGREPHPI